MKAKELLDAGRLSDAIEELNQEVKSQPANAHLRIFLFELLCFQGAYDRAQKQLDVIATQSGQVGTDLAVQVYRNLLQAEKTRQQVFQDGTLPKFFQTPPAYIDRYVVLAKKIQHAPDEIGEVLAQAEEMSPAVSGRMNDQAFASFRDSDDRVGPILEVFQGSDYLWLPWEQIKRLEISEPKKLRDLIWIHARIESHEQVLGDVFIPALYVFSHQHENDRVKLGRMTEWQSIAEQMVVGTGLRLFLVDEREFSLLGVRQLEFQPLEA